MAAVGIAASFSQLGMPRVGQVSVGVGGGIKRPLGGCGPETPESRPCGHSTWAAVFVRLELRRETWTKNYGFFSFSEFYCYILRKVR